MRKKMIYTMMITGVLAINLTGCGSKTEKQEVTATETEITLLSHEQKKAQAMWRFVRPDY